MKWSPLLHTLSVIVGTAGVLAILGAWWTQLSGQPLLGMTQQHLFNDAIVLMLTAIWFGVGGIYHHWLKN